MHCVFIRLLRFTWNRIGIVINRFALERNKKEGVGKRLARLTPSRHTMLC